MNRPRDLVDPRTWLLWLTAVSLPVLIGRNPFTVAAVLIAVALVRTAWSSSLPSLANWTGIIRLAAIFAAIGVIFNLLTVRAGDRVLATIPNGLPLLGGDALTWNALIYGILSGLALLVLVLAGTTAGALIDWSALLRLMPDRLSTVAVAGSIAFTFVPQTAHAFVEIREAQAARGHRLRGGRDLLPILAPMLAGGLDRAVTLSESLESRAFGAPARRATRSDDLVRFAAALGLASAATSAYGFAIGNPRIAVAALVVAILLALSVALPGGRPASHRTRYRSHRWTRADLVIGLAALLAIGLTLRAASSGSGIVYAPYPLLHAPDVDLALLAALLVLAAPAWYAPSMELE